LKKYLENPQAAGSKVAVSQYPRGGAQTGNRPVMGYSMRDEQWRLTLWRDRRNGEIIATELYDEKNDPAETVNVGGKTENREIIEKLTKYIPFFAPQAAAPVTATTPPAKPPIDRDKLFERKDKNHDGKLTRDEFLADQPDPEAAKGRWDKWDLDKDGTLSRDEFVFQGKKK